MRAAAPSQVLRTVLGTYPHTAPLKQGAIASPRVALDFVDIRPTYKAFKSMVREQQFDVCEMAIVTALQARAFAKPLVLLPAVMFGRFQHGAMLCNAERRPLAPSDLSGCRVGVRSYAQTTGVWLRGILADDYGVDLDRVHWVTFEDAHVAEYRDPPQVERAAAAGDMTAMLLDSRLDAAIYGGDVSDDPRLRSVIPDPEAAARAWYRKRGVVPINHVVVVTEALARSRPDIVRELFGLLLEAKRRAALAGDIDFAPFGLEALRPALQLITDYALAQRLIPGPLAVEDLFDETTRALDGG